jgi:hypothetical protein
MREYGRRREHNRKYFGGDVELNAKEVKRQRNGAGGGIVARFNCMIVELAEPNWYGEGKGLKYRGHVSCLGTIEVGRSC